MRWAVFDVDGTLLPHVSMEQEFIRYGIREGLFPLLNFGKFLINAACFSPKRKKFRGFRANKMYLSGLPVGTIERVAEIVFAKKLSPNFSESGKKVLKQLKKEGYHILLMTGSPAFLAQHLTKVFSPEFIISTKLEITNGKYTGQLADIHPYGEGKKAHLCRHKKLLSLDFEKAIVFANHHSDAVHMKMFRKAVAVNPTPKLQQIAAEQNWDIAEWVT